MNLDFFKTTQLYKDYIILDLIEKNKRITQRVIASKLGISVSMVNLFLDKLEKENMLKKKKYTSKKIDYNVTKEGIQRKKVLNLGYLKNAQELYHSAKINIISFLSQLELNGYKNILIYGSGEVAEILMQTINSNNNSLIKVVGVVDDDILKIGKKFIGINVISLNNIVNIKYDGILISSYTNHNKMFNKLKERQINESKIISFF
jgi:DNA-binding Lrp family transcriptional regulator